MTLNRWHSVCGARSQSTSINGHKYLAQVMAACVRERLPFPIDAQRDAFAYAERGDLAPLLRPKRQGRLARVPRAVPGALCMRVAATTAA